jgi:hypothetical protein
MNGGPDPDGFIDFFARELSGPLRVLAPADGTRPNVTERVSQAIRTYRSAAALIGAGFPHIGRRVNSDAVSLLVAGVWLRAGRGRSRRWRGRRRCG